MKVYIVLKIEESTYHGTATEVHSVWESKEDAEKVAYSIIPTDTAWIERNCYTTVVESEFNPSKIEA